MIYTRQAGNLPYGVKGFVIHDENDDYTIFLNDRLGRISNIKTLNHELEHIKNGDFFVADGADYIEWKRHRKGV